MSISTTITVGMQVPLLKEAIEALAKEIPSDRLRADYLPRAVGAYILTRSRIKDDPERSSDITDAIRTAITKE